MADQPVRTLEPGSEVDVDRAQVVRTGSTVRVRDEDGDAEFCIMEPEEADAAANRVSTQSPLGRALLGRTVGDEVRFRAPGGVLRVTVVEVRG
jgi:transcription elongation factor GreA